MAADGTNRGAGRVAGTTIRLRLLATSDLHMRLAGQASVGAGAAMPSGLGSLACIIARLRAEIGCSLLFDNGDLLQGTPLAEELAAQAQGVHPAIAWLNALRFDAATLGNHDLSYGTRFLRHVLGAASYPVVAANARLPGDFRLPPWVLLHREAVAGDGTAHDLRIGVLGLMPPQTAAWEAASMPGLRVDDIMAVARREVPRMRAAGADVVVVLAHSGLSRQPETPGMENAAAVLAALPGVDAVVAGHTHQPFPSDGDSGLVAGTPVVLPGFGGSCLGVIDLILQRQGLAGWRVAQAAARLEAARGAQVPAALRAMVTAAQRSAARAQSGRVGRSTEAMQSGLAVIGRDAGLSLVTAAQRWHLRRHLRGTPLAGLPILVAAAPFRSGGRGGPAHYTDIPAGRLRLRDLADLYAFPNRVAALTVTGAELRDWLERAASLFARLTPGSQDQPLLDPAIPPYHFEVIFGLTWCIDLSAVARYDADGAAVGPPEGRVRDLRHHGRIVRDEDCFALATNSYRLSGVGLYAGAAGDPILDGPQRVRDVIHAYLRQRRVVTPVAQLPFRFAALAGTSAWFDTSPAVRLTDAPLRAERIGPTGEGFLRLRVHL